ncbi:dipicolinate synthase subunit DpsA [Virgibacillus sp. C22-A2]|uniref:Dipicolinate synthase subunit DpsA n=1 Tax=Virgibacillus tibetensis TaxID=3042313 RepID=A0ABU6KIT7_9BACI|nr:dipicolinate synthase subunit DpsA [Virgibacillus sp. C22-A2]
MLTKLNILIMGGDARNLEIITRLSSEGAKVFLVGFDQLSFSEPTIVQTRLDEMDLHSIDAIILPVAGTDLSGEVEATYSEKPVILSEKLVAQTKEHCIIYTGTSNTFLDNLAHSNNRKLVKLFARDDIAVYNSIPTAEGALKLAIEQTDVTVHGADVMVLGFGRVGKTVARLFDAVGATVTVGARKAADIARITEMGLEAMQLSDLEKNISSIDICINTIPYPIVDSKVITEMRQTTLIIDLASSPGGTDFGFAEKRGVKALHALGLPGKTAPKTAGRIIGEVIVELMVENRKFIN